VPNGGTGLPAIRVRAYATKQGTAIFRLDAHIKRFFQSAELYELEIPYSPEQLTAATLDLVRRNRMTNAYIRPIAFFDAFTLTVWPRGCPVTVAIVTIPLGARSRAGRRPTMRDTPPLLAVRRDADRIRCLRPSSDWVRWWGEQRRHLVERLINSCCA
jgi:branched-subunit amino acid aminotransferase/4-amino-4-deoxychorismate lyase